MVSFCSHNLPDGRHLRNLVPLDWKEPYSISNSSQVDSGNDLRLSSSPFVLSPRRPQQMNGSILHQTPPYVSPIENGHLHAPSCLGDGNLNIQMYCTLPLRTVP